MTALNPLIIATADECEEIENNPFQIGTPGSILFTVTNKWTEKVGVPPSRYNPEGYRVYKRLEFEEVEHDGCASWAQEGVGIDFWLQERIDYDAVRLGGTYLVHGMQVTFYRGDGWTTDDDEEWDWEGPVRQRAPGTFLKVWADHLWHLAVVWPLRNLKAKRKANR